MIFKVDQSATRKTCLKGVEICKVIGCYGNRKSKLYYLCPVCSFLSEINTRLQQQGAQKPFLAIKSHVLNVHMRGCSENAEEQRQQHGSAPSTVTVPQLKRKKENETFVDGALDLTKKRCVSSKTLVTVPSATASSHRHFD